MAELRGRGFRPQRRLGQCFLFDSQFLQAALEDASVAPGESIVEIGCGAGSLTRELLGRECDVLGAEIDPILCAYLGESIRSPRFELFAGDILASKNLLSPAFVALLRKRPGSYRLVANLPYAVATPVVMLLLALPPPPVFSGFAVLVQEEQAARWFALPGTPDFGPASVWMQLCGSGRVTRRAHRRLFTPSPRVDSVFCVWKRASAAPELDPGLLYVVRRVFQTRRKMLRTITSESLPAGDPWWERQRIDPRSRPENLTPSEHLELARELKRRGWEGTSGGGRDRRGKPGKLADWG